jgi:peptidoglycan glycosyltransferase
MPFAREVQRLLIGLIMAFLAVIFASTYWAIVGADTILQREDNPRLVDDRASIVRGDIYDRHSELLVQSVQAANGWVSRQFLHPSMNSALGYYSLRYGESGAEAAFNALLRGDDLQRSPEAYFQTDILHRPQRGYDIRLTFDLTIQTTVIQAMQGYRGAAIVLDVPTGEVLALASLPTFDPNTLDQQWEQLIQAPEQPFFNRALQGQYQPGALLQTPLLVAAINSGYPIDVLTEGASQPVVIDQLTMTCARRPPADRLTLGEAYAFACPAPFVNLFNQVGHDAILEIFELFKLGDQQAFILPGFVPLEIRPTPIDFSLDDALGQGDYQITPLHMAVIAASIVNDGNAPIPYTLLDTRLPETSLWTSMRPVSPTLPIMTGETARRLQELMRASTVNGAATRAARSGMNIGGHAALAYSGDRSYSWFTGFVITGARQGIAIVIVLEDHQNPPDAAAIGGQILEIAYKRAVGLVNR